MPITGSVRHHRAPSTPNIYSEKHKSEAPITSRGSISRPKLIVTSQASLIEAASPLTPTSMTSSASPSSTSPTSPRRVLEFDPLALNPPFQAPPRLHERRLLETENRKLSLPSPDLSSYFDDEDSDLEEDEVTELGSSPSLEELRDSFPGSDDSLDSPSFHRPILQRSHWSESTANSDVSSSEDEFDLESSFEFTDEEDCSDNITVTQDEDSDDHKASYQMTGDLSKHMSSPLERSSNVFAFPEPSTYATDSNLTKRPALKSLDDTFSRRCGWKRRGVVFQSDISNSNTPMRFSSPSIC